MHSHSIHTQQVSSDIPAALKWPSVGDGWCGGWQCIGVSAGQHACCCGQPSVAIRVGCVLARVDMLQAKRQGVLLCSCLPYIKRDHSGDDAGSGLLSCPPSVSPLGGLQRSHDVGVYVHRILQVGRRRGAILWLLGCRTSRQLCYCGGARAGIGAGCRGQAAARCANSSCLTAGLKCKEGRKGSLLWWGRGCKL